jgi:sucrose phosphorylase
MKNQVQLIAYVDRFSGGGLRDLQTMLEGPFRGLFGGVHLLPFFYPIDGVDAGFDPIDHTQVDPRLGTWDDLRAMAEHADIMADLVVNHVSRQSPQFADFQKHGDGSAYAGMFLTYDRVFPDGAREADLLKIYRPRPALPFTRLRLENGTERLLWTTFTPEQIDIDVLDPEGKRYLEQILDRFQIAGIRTIRLDAAGYAIKKPGTTCFMIPETYAFIGELTEQARARGIEVLVEIHSYYREQIEIAKHVDRVYDFVLPPLILHALYTGDARRLRQWLEISPRNAITVLDTHDGIGVIDAGPGRKNPEASPGLLAPEEIDALVETIHQRSLGESRQATGAAASNLDLYQVNCTYYDALGRRDDEYLMARAVQFFAPGIPQVYYVGLLAGKNDLNLLRRTGVGRDINRHYYTRDEVENQLRVPVVRSLMELVRFRNTHPAFSGDFQLSGKSGSSLIMEWRKDSDWARLEADFAARRAIISYSGPAGERSMTLGEIATRKAER